MSGEPHIWQALAHQALDDGDANAEMPRRAAFVQEQRLLVYVVHKGDFPVVHTVDIKPESSPKVWINAECVEKTLGVLGGRRSVENFSDAAIRFAEPIVFVQVDPLLNRIAAAPSPLRACLGVRQAAD